MAGIMTPAPYIGSKISLISKSEIRYEGTLYAVDCKESTIALSRVRSFGTENRVADNPVAPRDETYEFIIFRAADIKDLSVRDHVPIKSGSTEDTSAISSDPAILRISHVQQQLPQTISFPTAQFMSSFANLTNAGQFTSSPPSRQHEDPRPPKTISPHSAQFGVDDINARHRGNMTRKRPSLPPRQSFSTSGGARYPPFPMQSSNEFRAPRTRYPEKRSQDWQQIRAYPRSEGRWQAQDYHRGDYYGYHQVPYNYRQSYYYPEYPYQQYRNGRSGTYEDEYYYYPRRGGNVDRYYYPPKSPARQTSERRRAPAPRSERAQRKAPVKKTQKLLVPKDEFNFEEANKKFAELKLEGGKREGPEEEKADESGEIKDESKAYDKSKSFFDALSRDSSLEKPPTPVQEGKTAEKKPSMFSAQHWRKERKLNEETFGQAVLRRSAYRARRYSQPRRREYEDPRGYYEESYLRVPRRPRSQQATSAREEARGKRQRGRRTERSREHSRRESKEKEPVVVSAEPAVVEGN